MTHEEASSLIQNTLDKLGEHFEAIQIHATWMDEGRSTKCIHKGSGNFYARESIAREFVTQNENEDLARMIAYHRD